jgi:hypothetical protein
MVPSLITILTMLDQKMEVGPLAASQLRNSDNRQAEVWAIHSEVHSPFPQLRLCCEHAQFSASN